ncbi:MAG: polymorphic toxin type 44 domain-containing protein [Gammaproteobacteria bacterium]|nr:polymorphic toxin type 44 domain-containing protein [Gammaproteobacteria bacterium]
MYVDTRAVVRQRRDEGGDGAYETAGTRSATFSYYRAGYRKGLLRTETRQPGDAALKHTTEYDYDAFGRRVRAAVTAGGVTRCDTDTLKYDPHGRVVVLERDCLGRPLRRTSAYNAHGLPTRAEQVLTVRRGSNNQYTITATRAADHYYTAGGRRYFTHADDGSYTGTLRAPCAGVSHCPAGAAYYTETRAAGGGRQWAYRDVLDRVVRARTAGFNYGLWVDTDTDYDALGRVARQSEPYFTGDPVYRTVHSYDLLGRVVRTTLPDYDADADVPVNSVITTAYAGLTTTTTNGKGQSATETRNALGEVTRSADAAGTPVVHTYDAWGQVVKTTTGTGNKAVSVTRAYDARGRRIRETDPDRGVTRYAYNGFDELIRQTDAVGNVQAMTYDTLGRRITRRDTAPDGADADTQPDVESDVTWTYDPDNGLGQLGKVTDTHTGYARRHRYDTLGRAALTDTTVRTGATPGTEATWYSRQTWDGYGRPHQFFDAARQREDWTGNAVEVQYNAWGYAHRWVDGVYEDGAPRRTYRTVTFRDARGNATGETLGGGAVRVGRAHDAKTGRVTSVTGRGAGHGRLQTLTYEWDLLGNLGKRSETSIGKALEETFTYDTLNRLVKAQVSGRGARTVSYAANGNITSKTGVGDYRYGTTAANTPGPHAVVQAGKLHYAYDANGNMLTETRTGQRDPARSFTWSAANQVRTITQGMTATAFVYGPDRSRIQRTDTVRTGTATSTTTTVYLGHVEQVIAPDGSFTYKRYLTNGVLITQAHDKQGQRTGETTRYLLRDHLGSVDVITNAAGRVEQDLSFDAWGQRRAPDDWTVLALLQRMDTAHGRITPRGFTGHEMLDGVGIIHMNGRIYDPKLGRFLQADPIIQFPHYSQGQNRYSYVLNNPLTYTDPTGYFIGKLFKKVFKGLNKVLGDFSPFLGIALLALPGVRGWVMKSWLNAFAFGFATGGIAGGSLRGALFGGISAAAFYGIGEHFTALTGLPEGGLGHILTHGLTGGILAELQGGQFGHGFLAAGLSKAVMGRFSYEDGSAPAVIGRTSIAAIVGGTISRITGGKFANGALTSAMAQLFNAETSARAARDQAIPKEFRELMKDAEIDLSAHIAEAEGMSNNDFVLAVQPKGKWDYKYVLRKLGYSSSLRDNFGNFHFGVVAAARGFNLETAMYGAGYYQTMRQGGGHLGHFVSASVMMFYSAGGYLLPDFISRRITRGGFTWGDNPGDSTNIMKGWDYYDSR